MQQPWFTIFGSILGIIIGAFFTYLLQGHSQKHQASLQHESQKHEDELQTKTFLLNRDLDAVYKFIQTDGLKDLLGFFTDQTSPYKLLNYLERLSEMDHHFKKMGYDFQELKSELASMRGMLNERLFNPVTARIHDGIESNKTFTSRLKENSESKRYLERHWLKIEPVQEVLRTADSIFIESGSTLAYCMLSIVEEVQNHRSSRKPLRVCTNNVAIYMMLLFKDGFEPVLLPGKPNNPYAATFGDIGVEGEHGEEIKSFLAEHEVKVLFTTASYLDIGYGPHVSSKQNHAMKRILNDYINSPDHHRTGIFVIVAENINQGIKDQKIDEGCKLIFDPDCTENVLKHSDILDKTRVAWEEYLRRPNNYIISGSSSLSLSKSRREEFIEQHDKMEFLDLPADESLLFKLYSL